jgi:hypothetical protein
MTDNGRRNWVFIRVIDMEGKHGRIEESALSNSSGRSVQRMSRDRRSETGK